MKNSLLWQDVVSVAGRRAVSILLALVVALGLGAVTIPLAQAQAYKEKVLHSFTGKADGGYPSDPLIMDAQGNLYGTASEGGDLSCGVKHGCGVVFKVDPSGGYSLLHAFHGGDDGFHPTAGLFMDALGNLYGTTKTTVFRVSNTGKEKTLWHFDSEQGTPDGQAGVIMDAKGNLYGTTDHGAHGTGTVYRLSSTGEMTILYSFPGVKGGIIILAGVIMDAHGNLYGDTYNGGGAGKEDLDSGYGTVFKLTANSDGSWEQTVLHTFNGGIGGAFPDSNLVMDGRNIYGTTYGAGFPGSCKPIGCGTVFRLSGEGKLRVLWAGGGELGQHPYGPLLVRDGQKRLYGTTAQSGVGGGLVFKLSPVVFPFWKFTALAHLKGSPLGSVIMDAHGNFYGTTYNGGAFGDGAVFKLTR